MANMTNQVWKIRHARARQTTAIADHADRPRGVFIPLPATLIGLTILAAIVIGVGVAIWQAIPRDPADGSTEAGFLRDMVTHHSQAVEMALAIRDRTQDENLRYLTTDIALTQSGDMGTMQGYLNVWDLPLTGTGKPMAWMGHPVDALMPGMATPDQVVQLRTLPEDQAEVLFLQLMIRHHQSGIAMAEGILKRSDQPQVTLMAQRIIVTQKADIDTMNQMLVARGQQPVTDPLPMDHS